MFSSKIDDKIIYQELSYYFKGIYGSGIKIYTNESKNYGYDWMIRQHSFCQTIEVKTRFLTQSILRQNDVLIELIQNVPALQVIEQNGKSFKLADLAHGRVNDIFSPMDITMALGWFFKCNADRLVFLRYFREKAYDIIDIAFRGCLKEWLYHNMKNYQLIYSSLTTGTVNLILPVKSIPASFVIHKKLNDEGDIGL